MKPRNLVVMGASAGGLEALQRVLGGLPADLHCAVLIVLHTSSTAGRMLPQILNRSTFLPVRYPQDGEEIEEGHVYVAPPDFHMTVEESRLRVLQGARENRNRPAIDPLFRSAARYFGSRVVAVVLTGLLDDGALGLMVVRSHGGIAIVEDPSTAQFPGMPENALEQVPDAAVLPLSEISSAIAKRMCAGADAKPERSVPERTMDDEGRRGQPSSFACPDCGGVLWEVEDNGFLHFRCRVGHAFTPRHLDAEQRHAVETALWSGLRALEESASLYRRMANRAIDHQRDSSAERFNERATNSEINAQVLKQFLLQVNRLAEE